jgi:hypothetical protein
MEKVKDQKSFTAEARRRRGIAEKKPGPFAWRLIEESRTSAFLCVLCASAVNRFFSSTSA